MNYKNKKKRVTKNKVYNYGLFKYIFNDFKIIN